MRKITRIRLCFFSPTGNTVTVARYIGSVLANKLKVAVQEDDFTLLKDRQYLRQYEDNELVVFAMPTYAGRLPNKIAPDLREKFLATDTPAIALVTFGNRSFDNSLAELSTILSENSFTLLAAAAFACKHAFAEIGTEHPTTNDYELMDALAQAVIEKLKKDNEKKPEIPGNGDAKVAYYQPLKLDGSPAKFLKAKPLTNKDTCNNCGLCARLCPMAAINPNDVFDIPGTCIKCQSCVIHCPKAAKYFDDPDFLSHKKMLEKNYARAVNSEIFI